MNRPTASRPLGGLASAAALLTVVVFISRSASSLTVNGTQLAKYLAGDGVTIVAATVTLTSPKQAGRFAKPNRRNGIGLTSGVVLSSAWATEENGTNDNQYLPGSDDLLGGGYEAFDSRLPPGYVSSDACVLRIEFKCSYSRPVVYFNFVYGTDDYPWSGTRRDNGDMMGAFLENESRRQGAEAFLYRRELFINMTDRLASFKDNMARWYQTEMNGFTKPLTVLLGPSETRSNVLYVAVADTGRMAGTLDGKNSAWLFIEAGSLKCANDPNDRFSNVDVEDDDYVYDDEYAIDDDYFDDNYDDDVLTVRDDDDYFRSRFSPSAQPSASPYPTIPLTGEPTLSWTSPTVVPFSRVPQSPQSCAWEISKACSCGDYSCYETYIEKNCKINPEKHTPSSYRKKAFKVVKNNYCN